MQRQSPQSASATPSWLTPGVKLVLSLLFAFHLAAIFLAPMTAAMGTAIRQALDRLSATNPETADNQTPPGRPPLNQQGNSPSPTDMESPGRPRPGAEVPPALPQPPWPLNAYLDLAYLNHGYGFFAPDPGPSHLVHYTIELRDGTILTGEFPNRDQYWPRLRYHRHFMLSEQVGLMPMEFGKSYARHLLKKHDARRVTLEYRRHLLASPADVLAGLPLDTPESYLSRPLVSITAEDLVEAQGP